MRHLFLLFIVSLTAVSFALAQDGAKISFNEEKHEFGVVDEGPKVSHEFVFTNTGTEPLILSRVKASCGCTTPSWTKDPVQPGEKGTILVTYSTAGRKGKFNKSISITSNAIDTPNKMLYISGNVLAVPEEETMPVKQPLLMSPN